MSVILTAVATLGVIGAGSAGILYLVGQKFKVEEDPRIQEVLDALPAANCGGCGFPGCASFAAACVKAETMDGLFCPVGGQ
jgi:Na+-translocating ferredoxin:NAD+ oxidoreductase RNF subunit RnfB